MNTTSNAVMHHHRRRMIGRDPYEAHRAATPLELLFDLTFVVAFGVAANELAHALAEGHYIAGLIGFGVAGFAITWAWTNFSWFSSAYDTDDWPFRVVTMVQMVGVLVLATGLPRMFASIEHGEHLDIALIVAGYVIMRLALVFQWLRVASQDPASRRVALTFAGLVAGAQVLWIALALAGPAFGVGIALYLALMAAEVATPLIAERIDGGTPWHAHHIVERYGLFAIIAMGEGVVGAIAALSAGVDATGWSIDGALACFAAVGLTFGLWWIYYMLPSAEVLHRRRECALPWAFAQMALIVAIVGIGAGLHVAAYAMEGEAHISALATILTVAIPVGAFLAIFYGLYTYLVHQVDVFHFWLLGGTVVVFAAAIAAAVMGYSIAVCLVILAFSPLVTVVGYEVLGYRHREQALADGSGAAWRR